MLACAEARLLIDEHHYFPWLQKGVALRVLGHGDAALAAFQRAITEEREEPHASAWMNKAELLAERDDRLGALLHLGEAVRINPSFKDHARTSDSF